MHIPMHLHRISFWLPTKPSVRKGKNGGTVLGNTSQLPWSRADIRAMARAIRHG